MRTSTCLAVAVVTALALAPAAAEAADPVLRLRAFAVNMSGTGRSSAGTLDIVVERWSTDEEQDKLRAVLVEGGGEKLLDALQDVKPRAGYISTSTSLGWDLQFARQIPYGDGARRIILATDRPMSFFELRNQPRSRDYEFLLVEIRLNKNGVGEGKLAGAAKVSYDADTRVMEIENYGIEPVRLTKVEVVGK
ncbi:MAG TPA: hypothetical protein VII13_18565 [Vicinamibacteria bacterium]